MRPSGVIVLDGGELTFSVHADGSAAQFDMRAPVRPAGTGLGSATAVVNGQRVTPTQTLCTNLPRIEAVQLYRLLGDWLAAEGEDVDEIHEPSYIAGQEAERDRLRGRLGL